MFTTIKNIVKAPLAWFAAGEDVEQFRQESGVGGKRRRRESGPMSGAMGGESGGRVKRIRIDSPERDVEGEGAGPSNGNATGNGYLDPPISLLRPPPPPSTITTTTTSTTTKASTTTQDNHRPNLSLPSSRRTISPALPPLARAQGHGQRLTRTMSIDPPSRHPHHPHNTSSPEYEPAAIPLPLSRDVSMARSSSPISPPTSQASHPRSPPSTQETQSLSQSQSQATNGNANRPAFRMRTGSGVSKSSMFASASISRGSEPPRLTSNSSLGINGSVNGAVNMNGSKGKGFVKPPGTELGQEESYLQRRASDAGMLGTLGEGMVTLGSLSRRERAVSVFFFLFSFHFSCLFSFSPFFSRFFFLIVLRWFGRRTVWVVADADDGAFALSLVRAFALVLNLLPLCHLFAARVVVLYRWHQPRFILLRHTCFPNAHTLVLPRRPSRIRVSPFYSIAVADLQFPFLIDSVLRRVTSHRYRGSIQAVID